jgi:hypothetical protein
VFLSAVYVLRRTKVVHQMDGVCVEENGDCDSDGSKCLVENGDCIGRL